MKSNQESVAAIETEILDDEKAVTSLQNKVVSAQKTLADHKDLL
jgi:hypothetical protein